MAKQNYERLSIEVFGRHLIESGDLDPVYIALPKAITTVGQRNRWLMAYWCFYHCGVASYLSEHEGAEFLRLMMEVAHNETRSPLGGRWPRASERRHARGQSAIDMVSFLRKTYGTEPEQMVAELERLCQGGILFKDLALHVRGHVLFGPWIAFKVGDMLERVCGCPVNFDNADVFMFKDPTKAAIMLYKQKAGLAPDCELKHTGQAIREVVDYLIDTFKDLDAPPLHDRAIGLQEVETVLCKWKSHMNGHYPLNNDIDEITEGLSGWGPTAQEFSYAMPKRMEP